MRKLVKYEFKKIGTAATILLFLFLLLANAITSIKAFVKEDYEDQIRDLYLEYTTDPKAAARWKEYYKDIETQNELIEKAWWDQVMSGIKEPLQLYDPCLISGSKDITDRKILSELFKKEKNVEGLAAYYQSISSQAEENRLELLQEGKNEKDQAVVIQQKMRDRYQALSEKIDVDFAYSFGWDRYFSYRAVDVFIFLFLLWIAAHIFTQENRFHMYPAINSSSRGLLHVSAAKLLVMLLTTLFTIVVFLAETLLILGVRLGFSSLGAPIQLFEEFRLVPFAITVGEYLALSVLSKFLVFFSFSCIVLLISIFTGSALASLGIGVGYYGFSWLFWRWNYSGTPSAAYYLNMISAAHFTEVSTRYRLLGFGRTAFSTFALTFLLPCFILAFSIAAIVGLLFFKKAALLQFRFKKTDSAKVKRADRFPKEILRKFKTSNKKTTIWRWELYKNFIAKKRYLIILCIVVLKMFFSFSSTEPIPYTQVVLKEYANRWEGTVTREKLDRIDKESDFINSILKGEYPTDNVKENIALYEYARGHQMAMAEFSQRVNRLWEIQEQTGIPCYIVYDFGWEKLFNQKADMLLYTAILILSCGVFSSEHGKEIDNGNMYALLRSTPNGRTKTFRFKISVTVVVTVLLSIAFVALDIIMVLKSYPPNLPGATLISLYSFGNIHTAITIKSYLGIWCFTRILSACFLALFTVSCSELTRTSVGAFLLTIFFTLIPTVLVSFGFSDFYQVAFLDLFSVTPLIKNGFAFKKSPVLFFAVFLAITAIVSILFLFVALKRYNKWGAGIKFVRTRKKENK